MDLLTGSRPRLLSHIVIVLSAITLGGGSASGQSATGVFRGTVVRDSARTPLEGVEVAVEGVGVAHSSAQGRFALLAIAPGRYSVTVRHPGLQPIQNIVRLGAGDTIDVTIVMLPLRTELPTVEVKGEARPFSVGMAEFERRRATGPGKFLSTGNFKGRENATLKDILGTDIPGLILERLPNGKTPVASRRAAQTSLTFNSPLTKCYMSVWVDGQRIYSPNSGADLPSMEDFQVSNIVGVELYRGAEETPLQFGGTSSQCGTIVIWTGRK